MNRAGRTGCVLSSVSELHRHTNNVCIFDFRRTQVPACSGKAHRPGSTLTASVVTIAFTGDIDIATAPAWFALAKVLVEQSSRETVCIDLAGVTFMDSSGLSMLVQLSHLADTHGARLNVGNPPARLQKMFGIRGLEFLTA
jgi:anti-sigma B factor antagonist